MSSERLLELGTLPAAIARNDMVSFEAPPGVRFILMDRSLQLPRGRGEERRGEERIGYVLGESPSSSWGVNISLWEIF
jgi:hypothetical protein